MNLSKIKSRYAGIQTKLKNISDGGCLLLSLCSIIEEVTGEYIDLITVIQTSRAKGWLTEDYEVKDSPALLNAFTGKTWKRREVQTLPLIKDNEFTIEKWYREVVDAATGKVTKYTHFKRRFVDTLVSSVTVKEGELKGYYIYWY